MDFSTLIPLTTDKIGDAMGLFAPWVRDLGLREITVGPGRASAVLPQGPPLQWAIGAVCGQAMMAAIDTIATLAVMTGDRPARGTASQNNQFLRPAFGADLAIVSEVLQFGKTIVYLDTRVSSVESGDLVAHATSEFIC